VWCCNLEHSFVWCCNLEHSFVCGAVIWTLKTADKKQLEVSKCGAEEGWRLVGPIV
jgi:hypothetical protein